jgi:hypothetical protein
MFCVAFYVRFVLLVQPCRSGDYGVGVKAQGEKHMPRRKIKFTPEERDALEDRDIQRTMYMLKIEPQELRVLLQWCVV